MVLRHVYREDGDHKPLDPLTAQLNVRVGGLSQRSRRSSFTRVDTRQTYNESVSRTPTHPDESHSHERHAHFDDILGHRPRKPLGSATPQKHHSPAPVGRFMAAQYAKLELLAAHQADEAHIAELIKLLRVTSGDLIGACCDAIDHILLALMALQRHSLLKRDNGREHLREAGAVSSRS